MTDTRPLKNVHLDNLAEVFEIAQTYADLGGAITEQVRDTTGDLPERRKDADESMTAGAAGYVDDRLIGQLYALAKLYPDELKDEIVEFAARVRDARRTS